MRFRSLAVPAVVAATLFVSSCATRQATPPVARMEPKVLEIHGDRRDDPYYWMNQRGNPDVIAHLEAENRYTDAVMRPTRRLQRDLYRELRARIVEDDETAPVRHGAFVYFNRTEKDREYPIRLRRPIAGGPEEVVLDENALASEHEYFRVGTSAVSEDHRLLAYGVDTVGREQLELRVRDIAAGRDTSTSIPNTTYGVAWDNDAAHLYYLTQDETLRPFRVVRHRLGSDTTTDVELYREDDATFTLDLEKSRSGRFLYITSGSTLTTEIRFIDLSQPESAPVVFAPRRRGIEYSVTDHGDHFYMLTNEDAKNFRLVRTPIAAPGSAWEEVIAHDPSVMLESVDAFANHLIVTQRSNGLPNLRVMNTTTRDSHLVVFPEATYSVRLGTNMEYETALVRIQYTSPVTPNTFYDYDLEGRELTVVKREEVPGFDPARYRVERLMAPAADGTPIPISLIHRVDFRRDGTAPLMLSAYGSYGAPSDARFNRADFSLLDRGFVVATAHIRGGGEFGKLWYEDGKLLRKRNTFTDFIDCTEFLIAQQYTSAGRIAIEGGSAGGLLIGAVVNMRPDLYGAAIADVPFVDVLTTMLDPTIPLTTLEYDEWGNPEDPTYYAYMKTYSPYDNVTAQAYPRMLIRAGYNDPRVQYWEPAKWAARLRVTKTDDHPLLLKTNMGAGHFGASGRFGALEDIAFDQAFVLTALGVAEP